MDISFEKIDWELPYDKTTFPGGFSFHEFVDIK
jgi:hypothetical protein